MIYDTLNHIGRYLNLGRDMEIALNYLRHTDFSIIEDGRYELSNHQIYASISTYQTRKNNSRLEAHRKYIDIQYLVSGEECIGIAPLEEMQEEVEAHPESDIWFYHGKMEKFTLGHNRFCVLFPEDAHAPCIAISKEEPVRKCVIKVPVSGESSENQTRQ